MEEGSIVYINYIGREKESGRVFDTNIEEEAKKAGIFEASRKYKPLPVIIGARFLLRGVEEELKKMNVGEKRTIELSPENAFGNPDPKLRKYFPIKEFLNKKIEPKVGQVLDFGGYKGRVISVDGGRVLVDFNHPLAGKKVEFEVEILKEVKDTLEKVKAIVDIFTNRAEDFEVELKNGEVKILDKAHRLDHNLMHLISENIFRWIEDVNKVSFIYEFEKRKKENKE